MDIGLCVPSKIDDIGYVALAEQLGYRSAWFADSQMIWSDCFAALALAAQQTRTMELGTGVSVIGTRTAPVIAHSIATINRLAPGRTFLAVGNGNTAWRLMGHKPVTLARFEDDVRVIRDLLDGKETAYTERGRTTQISFQMAELGFIALEPRIPLHMSGFGPRSQALAGRYADGLVMSIPAEASAMERVMRNVGEGAAAAGRDLAADGFRTASLTCAVVLEAGEDLTSDRVIEECGPFVTSSLHYAYDRSRQYGTEPPRHLLGIWEEYCALVEREPELTRHNRIHAGHTTYLLPEERRFVTPELIRATCLVGSGAEIVEQLGALEAAGLHQVLLLPSLDRRYENVTSVARHVLSRL